MSLVDLQQQIRDAVVGDGVGGVFGGDAAGDPARLVPMLVGGRNAARRLAIHRRHYEASLTAAVVGRFPATGWLIGPWRLEDAARRFVSDHPPTAPCIAEYGRQFPPFLAAWPETTALSYVPQFADLDWHLGRLAVSIEEPALRREHFAAVDAAELVDVRVTLQPGTQYVHAAWPIDALMTAYLSESVPESWTMVDEEVHLEVRGDRGSFTFTRVTAGDYAFRVSLAEGLPLGAAAGRALEIDPQFDAAEALLSLVDARLVTSLDRAPAGARS